MAYGMELVLGFSASELGRLAAAVGIKLPSQQMIGTPDEIADQLFTLAEPVIDAMSGTLREVHRGLLAAELGAKVVDGDYPGYLQAKGRTFNAFTLELFADPQEAGDDVDEFIIGVALTSRYSPAWVDLEYPNGAPSTLRLDGDTQRRIDAAHKALAAAYPVFAGATLISKFRHY